MSELSPETEELLSRGREGTSMSRAHRDEIKGAVLAKLATGAILTTSTSAAAWTATTKMIGVAVIAAVVGAGSVGVVKYQHARAAQNATTTTTPTLAIANATAPISPATSPSAAIATAPLDVTAGNETPQTLPQIQAPVPIADPAAAPTISNPVVAAATVASPSTLQNRSNSPAIANAANNAPSGNSPGNFSANDFTSSPNVIAPASTAPHPSSLEEETILLRAAHDALAANDPARALRLLDEDAARFPNGALEPERSAERVFAFCAEQKIDDAHSAAGKFLTAHPSGPLAARVRSSCGGR